MRDGRRRERVLAPCVIVVALCICFALVSTIVITVIVEKNEDTAELIKDKTIIKTKGKYYSNNCWVPEHRNSCAPQFIVAGAMKCGTTSLWSYLLNHPQVLPLVNFRLDPKGARTVLAEKEVRFFNDPGYKQLVAEYGTKKAFEGFLNLFDFISPFPGEKNYNKITGEASPMYICTPGVAKRIYSALPHAKIIIMLRNPIDRAYSDFWFRKQLKIKSKDDFGVLFPSANSNSYDEIFQQCMESEMELVNYCKLRQWIDDFSLKQFQSFHSCYKNISKAIFAAQSSDPICRPGTRLAHLCIPDVIRTSCQSHTLGYGLYVYQLYEWVQLFPPENLLFIQSEEFYENTSKTMSRISQFLGIDPMDWDPITNKTYNIINPTSLYGSKLEVQTTGGKKGLQVGVSNTTSDYPPLDPTIRKHLLKLVRPFNVALVKLLGDPIFLGWNEDEN